MAGHLQQKIAQYRKDGKNLFSGTEALMVGLCHQDLYPRLIPPHLQYRPMEIYFQILDRDQRQTVMRQWCVESKKGVTIYNDPDYGWTVEHPDGYTQPCRDITDAANMAGVAIAKLVTGSINEEIG